MATLAGFLVDGEPVVGEESAIKMRCLAVVGLARSKLVPRKVRTICLNEAWKGRSVIFSIAERQVRAYRRRSMNGSHAGR